MNKSATLRRYRPVALLMLVLHLAGCHSWQTTTLSPAQVIAVEQPSTVRVTLTDGTQRTFDSPILRNDSIAGVDAVLYLAALSDVTAVEVRRFSIGKTVGAIVAFVGLPVIICAADDCLNRGDGRNRPTLQQ